MQWSQGMRLRTWYQPWEIHHPWMANANKLGNVKFC